MASLIDHLVVVNGKPLKVQLCVHRGRLTVDIRRYYLDTETNRLKPTRFGISTPADALPELIDLLKGIQTQLEVDGVLEFPEPGSPPKYNPHLYLR